MASFPVSTAQSRGGHPENVRYRRGALADVQEELGVPQPPREDGVVQGALADPVLRVDVAPGRVKDPADAEPPLVAGKDEGRVAMLVRVLHEGAKVDEHLHDVRGPVDRGNDQGGQAGYVFPVHRVDVFGEDLPRVVRVPPLARPEQPLDEPPVLERLLLVAVQGKDAVLELRHPVVRTLKLVVFRVGVRLRGRLCPFQRTLVRRVAVHGESTQRPDREEGVGERGHGGLLHHRRVVDGVRRYAMQFVR